MSKIHIVTSADTRCLNNERMGLPLDLQRGVFLRFYLHKTKNKIAEPYSSVNDARSKGFLIDKFLDVCYGYFVVYISVSRSIPVF